MDTPRLSLEHTVNGAKRATSPPVRTPAADDDRWSDGGAADRGSRPDALNAEGMARFFEHLGHRVVRTAGACWYDFYRGFYVSFPHARLVVRTRRNCAGCSGG